MEIKLVKGQKFKLSTGEILTKDGNPFERVLLMRQQRVPSGTDGTSKILINYEKMRTAVKPGNRLQFLVNCLISLLVTAVG